MNTQSFELMKGRPAHPPHQTLPYDVSLCSFLPYQAVPFHSSEQSMAAS